MEKYTTRRLFAAGNLLAISAFTLTGCTVDSYLTDTSAVECDGKRTKTDLPDDGHATFIVRYLNYHCQA